MISCGAMAEHTGTMMGIRIPKVPQAVPMEKDKNAAMTKIRAGMMAGGRLELSTMPRTYSPVMRRSRHTPLMVHAMIRIR